MLPTTTADTTTADTTTADTTTADTTTADTTTADTTSVALEPGPGKPNPGPGRPDPGGPVPIKRKLTLFFSIHWRGVLSILAPLISMLILLPNFKLWNWCAYTLVVMMVYWVSECIPLPVTAFLPLVIFPITGIMNTVEVCKCYMNEMMIMFLGSIILAYAIEQSGLHVRLALNSIKLIGYSHYRLLLAVNGITMFVSMWITNTAACTMMVPIVFALLGVFEKQGLLTIYEEKGGEKYASDMTACYFCAVTFSATIGGIGTLVGTATNLVFKGLFVDRFPAAPDYLTFPKFLAFAVPYMLMMEFCMHMYLVMVYFGFLRPNSKTAQKAEVSKEAMEATKQAVLDDCNKLGRITFWESAIILFMLAMAMFFCRSPKIFPGWGDAIADMFGVPKKFIKDSAAAMMVSFLMLLLPFSLKIFDNCKAKYMDDLPKGRIHSVLHWPPMNKVMPYSFTFLLGGGFALSKAAGANYSNLNGEIGAILKQLANLPNELIILLLLMLTIFLTNFASNVAMCTVVTPIAMQMAMEIKVNPLWYNIVTGFAASYCFILPVGTPGNLIVQSAANIETKKMIIAGAGPTLTTIIVSELFFCYFAPLIWPDLKTFPTWAV